MVFRGYMTLPWLYGSFAWLNGFSSWLYVITWLYDFGALISFFCVLIPFFRVVRSFWMVKQLSRGYMLRWRGYSVYFGCLYGFPWFCDFSVVIRFFCCFSYRFSAWLYVIAWLYNFGVVIVLLGGYTAMCRNALQHTVTCEFGFAKVFLPSNN